MIPKKQDNIFPLCPDGIFTDTITGIEGFPVQSGYLFCVTSWDKTAKAFYVDKPNSSQQVGMQQSPDPILCLCCVENNFIYGTATGTLSLWNVEQNKTIVLYQFSDAITQIKYSSELHSLLVSSLDGSIGIYNITTGVMNGTSVGRPVVSLATAGEYLAYHIPGSTEIINIASGKTQTTQLLGNIPGFTASLPTMEFFPDKTGMVVGGCDGRVNVFHFKLKDLKHTYAFKAHHRKTSVSTAVMYPVNQISALNDTIFLTAGGDGIINVWDRKEKMKLGDVSLPIAQSSQIPITTAKFLCNGMFIGFSVGNDYQKGSHMNSFQLPSIPVLKIIDDSFLK